MSTQLRISLLVGIVIYALVIIIPIKKKAISLKYSLLWLLSILILLIMALFPDLVYKIMFFLGFESPINAIMIVFIFIILLILISLSMIVTTQHLQIKKLVQTIGILENRIEHHQTTQGDDDVNQE